MLFWQGFIALFLLANTAAWLGAPRLLNRPAYLASFLTGFSVMTGYWLLLYLLWTPLLGLPYPPPLLGVQALRQIRISKLVLAMQCKVLKLQLEKI